MVPCRDWASSGVAVSAAAVNAHRSRVLLLHERCKYMACPLREELETKQHFQRQHQTTTRFPEKRTPIPAQYLSKL
jgi:hypothetical protein